MRNTINKNAHLELGTVPTRISVIGSFYMPKLCLISHMITFDSQWKLSLEEFPVLMPIDLQKAIQATAGRTHHHAVAFYP